MTRAAAAVALGLTAALLVPTAAEAGPKGCRGTLSGAVRGSFSCRAVVSATEPGQPVLSILGDPVPGVPSYVPGSFILPTPVAKGRYTLDTLGQGKASVAAEGGTLYTATKTTGQRGEVELTLTNVRRRGSQPDAYELHGSYRARLVPAASAAADAVVVVVEF